MPVCLHDELSQALMVRLCCSVEGGELFDRIIDENYNLTELDTVLFIRQICEGLQYMHKMYILHLDLKVNLVVCCHADVTFLAVISLYLTTIIILLRPLTDERPITS